MTLLNWTFRALFAALGLAVLAGCGGGSTANPFAGGRSFGYSATSGGGSPENGSFEVYVRQDGSFEPNGAVYSYQYDGTNFVSRQGDVTAGRISSDGNFTIEAVINKEGYPPTYSVPFIVVATGQAVTRGAHYEGKITNAYYTEYTFSGGSVLNNPDNKPSRTADYDLSVYRIDRSRRAEK